MSELNREQLIKAFEAYVNYTNCPEYMRDILSLIKKLTEENEAWQKQLISTEEKADKAYYELACEVEDLRAENERLKDTISRLGKNNDELARVLPLAKKEVEAQAKADTVRKIIQRIKEDAIAISLLSHPPKFMLEIREDALDQIAKEMVEDRNEESNYRN